MTPFRLARTAVFAAVCLGLGAAAHMLGGATVPAEAGVGAFALAFAAAYPLAGRERSLAVILPLLAGLQVLLHLMFSLSHAVLPPDGPLTRTTWPTTCTLGSYRVSAC
ncbi:hypothetical protein ACFQES_19790 [Nonomuraea salmonea]|uniref:hypothetical protein n=1 Tax=Nonomuraea salmonea TaxID=46181 RepID=UPI00360797CD